MANVLDNPDLRDLIFKNLDYPDALALGLTRKENYAHFEWLKCVYPPFLKSQHVKKYNHVLKELIEKYDEISVKFESRRKFKFGLEWRVYRIALGMAGISYSN